MEAFPQQPEGQGGVSLWEGVESRSHKTQGRLTEAKIKNRPGDRGPGEGVGTGPPGDAHCARQHRTWQWQSGQRPPAEATAWAPGSLQRDGARPPQERAGQSAVVWLLHRDGTCSEDAAREGEREGVGERHFGTVACRMGDPPAHLPGRPKVSFPRRERWRMKTPVNLPKVTHQERKRVRI